MFRFSPIVLLIFIHSGCRDNYNAELKDPDSSLLVVEGMLNAGQGATEIRLSQTSKLNDAVQWKPVLNAVLTVESINGDIYSLAESGNGIYMHNQLPLVYGNEYRLRIKTQGAKEYVSDYVVARKSPDIDSITWKKDIEGLKIYVSTHDASNDTRYYNWDFDETWEIRSFFTAEFEYIGGTTIIGAPNYFHYRCWLYDSSSTINLGTTAQLQQDVVSEKLLQFIPSGSDKLSFRYSILVKQQALSKGAYEYLQLMKRTTENIGTIFDPQPTELRGNIKCITDPAENVIGYVNASGITEKRVFITSVETAWHFFQDCESIDVFNHPDSIRKWVPQYLPWGAQYTLSGAIEYYYMAPDVCVDCEIRGGKLNMPSYW